MFLRWRTAVCFCGFCGEVSRVSRANRAAIQRSLQRCAPRRDIVSEDGRGTEYNRENRCTSRAATVTARDRANMDWRVALGDRCSVRRGETEARSN